MNTAFVISSGVHDLFSVMPKSGDSFYAQPGAVLDGDGSTPSAFAAFGNDGEADDVTVVGASSNQLLVIENYNDGQEAQLGTVQTGQSKVWASGWRLQWVDIADSYSRSISTSNGMVIVGCYIHDSGRLGIGGGGSNIVIEGNAIDDNGFNVPPDTVQEAGGIKTVAQDITIVGNSIENNDAPGIWTDVDATNVTIEGNHIVGNKLGIHIEISHSVTIRENQIDDNLKPGIEISASNNVTITDNNLRADNGGIVGNEPDRGSGPDGPRILNYLTVTGNVIINSGSSGVTTLPPGSFVKFKNNKFIHSQLVHV
jgi:parallel beta-helix repeat protein